MNKLFFKVNRSCGYSLQMIIDLEKKTITRGYCLAIFTDFITLKSKKDFNDLFNQFVNAGYIQIED